MSDHDALLEAIVANPDDDTVRLVYADWLDEHADTLPTPDAVRARAAFIRDDIAMSQRDEFDPARVRWELIEKPRREGERWANLPLPNGWMFAGDPLFRRGFPWAVRFASAAWRIPELPADSIPFEHVIYKECGYFGVDQVCTAPWRGRLRGIEFERRNTTSIDPRRLFEVSGLDRLERLAFRRVLGAPGVPSLMGSPLFRRLLSLTITDAPVGPTLASELARVGPGVLRELHLIGCRLAPAALGGILDVLALRKLEALSVGGDRIGAPEKFRTFGRAVLPPLRSLDVSEDSPKEAGLEALLASPLVGSLRRLALASCNLNGDRTRMLASGAFADLRMLDLARNPVGNEGAAALARSPHLSNLLVLRLASAQVGDEGILALLDSPLADGLALLDLSGSPASAETKELLVGRMGDRVRL